jgi:hypothetical protein
MILTGLELFSREKMPYCWEAAAPPNDKFANIPLAPDFVQGICDATQQIHLGIEPNTKWFEKWCTTRQAQRLKKAAQHSLPATDAVI